jgi:formiminoglutamase
MPSLARRRTASAFRWSKVGLITLDAHFDLGDTDEGLLTATRSARCWRMGCRGATSARSACPLPNAHARHARRRIGVYTISACKRRGIVPSWRSARGSAHIEALMVDFDIDVIDARNAPAPGARPGDAVDMFFEARASRAQPR